MKPIQVSITLSLAFFGVTCLLLTGAFCSDGKIDQEQATLALVMEYEARLGEITGEIDTLRANKTWLELKINDLKLLGKPVPALLYRSLNYKTSRIEALETSAQRVLDHIESLKGQKGKKSGLVGLKEEISAQGLLEWFRMETSENGDLILESTLPILFASGSSVVVDAYDPFLKQVAGFLKHHKAWIMVDGYTDTDPIKTQKFPSNFELGAIRAANIIHSLVRYGADPSMFMLASTGEYRFPDARPMTDNKVMERYVNLTLAFKN
jgi:chemotaxis protein MotB